MKSRGEREPLNLRIFPDEVLRQVCEPVEKFDAEIRDLIADMLVLMRIHNGIGLAAPQVGIKKRWFVCEIDNHSLILINPGIRNSIGQDEMIEGCLSLPEMQVNVTRSDRIHVDGYDFKGQRQQYVLTGLWARVVQHEMDHLDGVMICDYGKNLQTEKAMQSG